MKFGDRGGQGSCPFFCFRVTYSVTKMLRMLKSITVREIFRRCPQVKKSFVGGEFWMDGFFASSVGKHGDEAILGKYVKS
jgi:putative transposase